MLATQSNLKKARLSREKFLAGALEVLATEGESNLRIDRLVRSLGVTKGSFYWHFENRADFVRRIARYWEKWSTDRVVEEIGSADEDPKLALSKIHKIVTRDDLVRYDLVMRSWAMHEPEVAEIVQSVDRTRFDFVRRLFQEIGYEGDDLDIRARTFVVTASLWSIINRGESQKRRLKRLEAVLDLLTTPAVR